MQIKIGIDLHGVIDTNPDFFKSMLTLFRTVFGAEIWIVSGPPIKEIEEELEELGIERHAHYDHIASIVDYLSPSIKWQDEKGHWWTDEDTWWLSKSRICLKHSINVLIDDHKEYYEAQRKDGLNTFTRFFWWPKEFIKGDA
jgi:hypothetical protein